MGRGIQVVILVLLISFGSTSAFGAKITKIKDGVKAFIDLEDTVAEQGTLMYALNPEGKKKAIIKIAKVKGSKALGKILKGKAEVGFTLTVKAGGSKAKSGGAPDSETAAVEQAVTDNKSSQSAKSNITIGGLVGMAMDRMDVAVTDDDKASMSGIGFNFLAFMDYKYTSWLAFRGLAGIEMFNAKGSIDASACDGSADCTADIMYGALDFVGRIIIANGNFEPWAGAGFGVLFPASKKTNALDTSSIVATSVLLITAGFDWHISPDYFIPLSLDYALFPSSDQVTANWTAFRAGFGMYF